MARLLPFVRQQFSDANGDPLVGGKVYTYIANSSTPLATYTDSSEDTENTNPIILDASGSANIWISDSKYKIVVKDSNDVTIDTIDQVSAANDGTAEAATSAANAAVSEANAAASALAAAGSATAAAASATAAASSSTSAGTSATNAATSATTATTQASNASTSASNAATSESNALASKNAAATSATNAATSESNAAASAASITAGNYATKTGAETLTNKTITAPAITAPRIDVVTLDGQASSPGNPSAGDYKLFVSDTTQKLTLRDSSGNETTVGSGAGGGINYASANADAEAGTTGFATYKDAAGVMPVDGTGGSPTFTITKTTTNPLRGSGSFLLTHAASNQQGEGASFAITIDRADRGQQIAVSFDYEIVSGTYATGDLGIYIYDVTNGVVIQPSGYQIQGVGINSRFTGCVFQAASNSTSYRVCWHVATSTATAYTLAFENLAIGPQIVPVGFAGSSSTSFSSTLNSNTNVSSNVAFQQRVGDKLFVTQTVKYSGAGASSTFSTALPAGLSIDSTKVNSTGSNTDSLGDFMWFQSGVGWRTGDMVASGSTTLVAILDSGTGTVNSNTFAANDVVSIRYSVPIAGWSSNTIVSDSAATRAVTAKMYRNTAQTGVNPNNSFVKINVDTVAGDSIGMANTSNNRLDVKVPGPYRIVGQIGTATTNVLNNSYVACIYKNGSLFQIGNGNYPPVAGTVFAGVVAEDPAAVVGDYYELYLYGAGNNSASTLTTGSGAAYVMLSATLTQGPAQIQAATRVTARYTNSATSISGTPTTVVWTNKVSDTVGGMVSGEYTVQAPGDYRVSSALLLGGTFALNTQTAIEIQKNGVRWSAKQDYAGGAVTRFNAAIDDVVTDCVAGDKIRIQIACGATSPTIVSSADHNYIAIARTSGVN